MVLRSPSLLPFLSGALLQSHGVPADTFTPTARGTTQSLSSPSTCKLGGGACFLPAYHFSNGTCHPPQNSLRTPKLDFHLARTPRTPQQEGPREKCGTNFPAGRRGCCGLNQLVGDSFLDPRLTWVPALWNLGSSGTQAGAHPHGSADSHDDLQAAARGDRGRVSVPLHKWERGTGTRREVGAAQGGHHLGSARRGRGRRAGQGWAGHGKAPRGLPGQALGASDLHADALLLLQ